MMKNILVIGAGRSSSALIDYLLRHAGAHGWNVTVADAERSQAEKRVQGHSKGTAIALDIREVERRRGMIAEQDLVISLLPAFLHSEVARDCLAFKKHLITASYVSSEMRQMAEQARQQGLIFMGEMGLDPGIDHMSAMQHIHHIQNMGGDIHAFLSYTGGVIAPESDDNPWHYKFTWNPRNVVRAGQGTAQYLYRGEYKYIPYSRLFSKFRQVHVEGFGPMEMYANRDSLLYRSAYGLDQIPTIVRGTLRYPGFCRAWDALVQIGLTDGSYPILQSDTLSYRQWVNAYLDDAQGEDVEERVADLLHISQEDPVMDQLRYIGLFSDDPIPLKDATPADILEHRLLGRWRLEPEDKDLIVMQHEFHYTIDGEGYTDLSTMLLKGNHSEDTAMSRLVGLPLGIFVRQVMTGKIADVDVAIPVVPAIYEPVLEELKDYGVVFEHTRREGSEHI